MGAFLVRTGAVAILVLAITDVATMTAMLCPVVLGQDTPIQMFRIKDSCILGDEPRGNDNGYPRAQL